MRHERHTWVAEPHPHPRRRFQLELSAWVLMLAALNIVANICQCANCDLIALARMIGL